MTKTRWMRFAGVATAKDVKGDRWVGLIYKDWPVFVAEGEEVRYVGDVVAAIAAETPRIAREAAALVEVEYEPLPPVLDPRVLHLSDRSEGCQAEDLRTEDSGV